MEKIIYIKTKIQYNIIVVGKTKKKNMLIKIPINNISILPKGDGINDI